MTGSIFAEASALEAAGRLSDAEKLYQKVLAVEPQNISAVQALARLRFRTGRFQDALKMIDRALADHPALPELWSNRGAILAATKRFDEAVADFERALRLHPGFLGARFNRANALLELRRYADAATDYESVLRADPDASSARGGLLRCKIQLCDWKDLAALWERALADIRAEKSPVPPIVLTALGSSADDQLRCARILARKQFAARAPLWRGEPYKHTRIRLAYVSADFHSHATATLATGFFEEHDRSQFETYALSFGPDDGSPMRRRVERAFGRFIEVRDASDDDIAKMLRELEVDIAIDLKGLTANARPGIFARRPAPVQVSFLGYPGTMGVPYIDYLIADRIIIPPTERRHYSEAVVYLPDSYQPNDSRRQLPSGAPTRRELGLPEAGFVYCCFNNPFKITAEMFSVWMRLLKASDGGVLWLLEDTPQAMRNLRRECVARGVAAERLVFAPPLPPEAHLARHQAADLFLDTLPYNAHTTASDALWAGVPLLTCIGTTFAGRVAASLLESIGLPELVVQSLEDYHTLALKLAAEPETLAGLRNKLAARRLSAPLFNTTRYTRHLEAAYLEMVARQRRGERAQSFEIERGN
jgi:predicted O-linked N-acetylglucosamine transferase (SPINDLY family)